MCAASSSLPVPDSPGQQHARVRPRHLRRLLDDLPERGARPDHARARRRPARAAARSPAAALACSSAFFSTSSSRSRPSGFSRKSKAPARVAATASAIVAWPEIMMTGRVRALLGDERQQVDPAGVRQAHVEQVRVGVRARQAAAGTRPPVRQTCHGVARALQHQPQRGADVLLVVHDHDRLRGHASALSDDGRTQPEPGAAQPSLDERRGRRRPAARSSGRWRGPGPCRAS